MGAHKAVAAEIRRVLLISAAAAIAVLIMTAALGYFSPASAGGVIAGFICGNINFCLLAAAVLKISASENTNVSWAKRIIRRSYTLRMAFMAVFSIAAMVFLRVNPIAYAVMLAFPGFAVRIRRR